MGSSLDDVLALDTEAVLSRRLQTLVYLKGYSSTPYQARQLINHGHVAVSGRKVTVPGYIVTKDEEGHIQYTVRSPLNELSHPARPKSEAYRAEAPVMPKTEEKMPVVVPPKTEVTPVATPVAAPVAPEPQLPAAPHVPQLPAEPAPVPPAEKKQEKHAAKPKEHKKKETKEGEA
jgi:ribosomal protein S4